MCQPLEEHGDNMSTLCSLHTMPFFVKRRQSKDLLFKSAPALRHATTGFQHFLAATVSCGAQDQGHGTQH